MASAEFVSGRVLAALTGQPACGPVTGTRSCGNGSQFKRVSGKFHGQKCESLSREYRRCQALSGSQIEARKARSPAPLARLRARDHCYGASQLSAAWTGAPAAQQPIGSLSQLRHNLGGWYLGDLAYSLPRVQRHGLDVAGHLSVGCCDEPQRDWLRPALGFQHRDHLVRMRLGGGHRRKRAHGAVRPANQPRTPPPESSRRREPPTARQRSPGGHQTLQ